MIKYYTRACNFKYGSSARQLIKIKKPYPYVEIKIYLLAEIEIITRNKNKVLSKNISLKKIHSLSTMQRKKIKIDLKKLTRRRRNFLKNVNFLTPSIMGILNLTPDSFSDGGKYNTKSKSLKHISSMIKLWCRHY